MAKRMNAIAKASKAIESLKKAESRPVAVTYFSRISPLAYKEPENIRKVLEVGRTVMSDISKGVKPGTVFSFDFKDGRTYEIVSAAGTFILEKLGTNTISDKLMHGSAEYKLSDPDAIKRFLDIPAIAAHAEKDAGPDRPLQHLFYEGDDFVVKVASVWGGKKSDYADEAGQVFRLKYTGKDSFRVISFTQNKVELVVKLVDHFLTPTQKKEIQKKNDDKIFEMLDDKTMRPNVLGDNLAFYAIVDPKGEILDLVKFENIDAVKAKVRREKKIDPDGLIIAAYNCEKMSGKKWGRPKDFDKVKISNDPFIVNSCYGKDAVASIRELLSDSTSLNSRLSDVFEKPR